MHTEERTPEQLSGDRDIDLSVVMPAYRCADTIASDILKLEQAIASRVRSYEVLVVVDGDEDGTLAAATKAESDHVRVLGYSQNQGKGFAVIYGIKRARGQLVGFMDAGGDIAPDVWPIMLDAVNTAGADIVIGSKRHPGARVNFPILRRIYSFGYQQLIRMLFRLNVRDTQVGVKLFRREVVDTVAPLVLVKRFAFDIELLAVADHFGFRKIVEAPVTIEYQFSSSVNVKAVFQALWDTAAVFYRLYIRRYYDRRRDALQPIPEPLTSRQ